MESTPKASLTKQRLSDYVSATNISLNRLCRQIGAKGYSPAVLSNYLNDKYTGDVSKLETELTAFLDREAERKLKRKREIPFVETAAAKRILAGLRMAHLDGEIAVVTGGAGLGKTTALKEYARVYRDVIIVEADLSLSNKAALAAIAKAIGSDQVGSVNAVFNEVVSKLKDTGKLIIIDEAEHLPTRALDLVRRINDLTGCGIALVGLPRLIHNLKGKRGEHAYLYSRVGFVISIRELEGEDVEKIVSTYYPGSNGVWQEFASQCDGNARRLSKLLYRTDAIAQSSGGKNIGRQTVKMAAEMLVK